MSTDHKFQVNLRGVIDLLSDHLYSGPQVYLRELLQNAVDAIVARRKLEPGHEGSVLMEVLPAGKNAQPAVKNTAPPTLMVQDDGIGLTEAEVHEFLATIGQSSKREALNRDDFIGQFGIGLLSGFVVSEEIVVVTRSASPGSPTIEWRGRSDGTYRIRTIDVDAAPGTQVYLRAKEGSEEFFTPEYVRDTATHFGSLLPMPITVAAGKEKWKINQTPPWDDGDFSGEMRRDRLLEYGKEMFDIDFLDAIELRSPSGGVQGVAFVLPHAATMTARHGHRVYLKNMLLSEAADNLLPEWAFFVKCVVNATQLRPNAARESFYEDSRLVATREELGSCLKAHLIQLSKENKDRLNLIIGCHYLPIKALAVEDDEFYKLFIDWLPFETTLGQMTLGEYRQREKNTIRYVPSRDQFRQIAGVAAAQKVCIINAAYTYDTDLLEKLPDAFARCRVKRVDVNDLARNFDELTLEEREEVFDFLRLADVVLQPYRCAADLRKFEPAELPTLYTANDAATFLRSVEQSKEVADDLWSGILDGVAAEPAAGAFAQLCLNFNNPLIKRLAQIKNKPLIRRAVEMLYVQALLLGHYPLKAQEMSALSDGLLGLIELGLAATEKKKSEKKP
jgi:molecular chaperone HtpG